MIHKTLFHSYKVQIKANRTILFRVAHINDKTIKKVRKSVRMLGQPVLPLRGEGTGFL